MNLARRLVVILLLVAVAGCADKNIDTAKLQSTFQGWTERRAELDKGIAEISNRNYPAALEAMERVAYAPNLTKEQRKLVQDVIAKLKEGIRKSS
jgi:hypothetical protein